MITFFIRLTAEMWWHGKRQTTHEVRGKQMKSIKQYVWLYPSNHLSIVFHLYPGPGHGGSRLSKVFQHFPAPPGGSQGAPRPDEICNPSSVLWVCPRVSSTRYSLKFLFYASDLASTIWEASVWDFCKLIHKIHQIVQICEILISFKDEKDAGIKIIFI